MKYILIVACLGLVSLTQACFVEPTYKMACYSGWWLDEPTDMCRGLMCYRHEDDNNNQKLLGLGCFYYKNEVKNLCGKYGYKCCKSFPTNNPCNYGAFKGDAPRTVAGLLATVATALFATMF